MLIINFTVGKEYLTNEVINIDNSNDIQITIHNKLFKKNDTSNKLKDKWEFDVIVIDAGTRRKRCRCNWCKWS